MLPSQKASSQLEGLHDEVQSFMKDVMLERIIKVDASGNPVLMAWPEVEHQVL